MEPTRELLQTAWGKAKNICSGREYCSADIVAKLRTWRIPEEVCGEIIDRLKEEGYLDEQRYAEAFAHDTLRFLQWGPIKISYALRNKKIPEALISAAIRNINPELWMEILRKILEKKKKITPARSETEMKTKLIRYALGKGFEFSQIEKAMQEQE